MYTDYLAAPLLANEFWSYVTRENHPESDHETRELARLFNEWKNRAAKPQAEYRKKAALYWKRFSRIRVFEAGKVEPGHLEPAAEPQPAA
jgi:hypothetical protein